ncbi:MAG TPA: hypothetical protein EYG24_00010 [Methylococcales bacterium]|nr:hypothetical protein [Methylococcales bacterium]
MNKITPRMLRDLDATLPVGAECYLCDTGQKALAAYRKNVVFFQTKYESKIFLHKEEAIAKLTLELGRGLKGFLRKDIRQQMA